MLAHRLHARGRDGPHAILDVDLVPPRPSRERAVVSLGERDERDAAEAEFAPPSADDEPPDPASNAG